jgi:hypothetical protein
LVRLFGEQIYKKVLIIGVLRIGNFDNYYRKNGHAKARTYMSWSPRMALTGAMRY